MRDSVTPDRGFSAFPFMGVGISHTSRMRPRDVLARNLKQLMAASPGLSTFPQITQAGGGSNGTLDRIRRKDANTGVDNLDPLAKVYALEAWHLLLPTLSAAKGADGRLVITGTPTWPFTSIDSARFENLDQDQKLIVERKLAEAIDKGEAVTAERIAKLGEAMMQAAQPSTKHRNRG